MTNRELEKLVLKRVKSNHIWINAFSLVRPSDETVMAIGNQVIEMLKQKENLLPSYWDSEKDSEVHELQKLTPVLYLSINQS